MNILAIGRTEWLYDAILALRDAGHTITGIITAKAAPEYTRTEDDFVQLGKALRIPVAVTSNLDSEEAQAVLSAAPHQLGISINWISIVQERHIARCTTGILNLHMGDLPRYRGNACPNWAILNGETSVTLTSHLMEGGKLDCGKVIAQKTLPIDDSTYIADIYRWESTAVIPLCLESVALLEKNPAYQKYYAPADNGFRCYPRRPEDGKIDWKASATAIHRIIRASGDPFAGAFCTYRGEQIVISRAALAQDDEEYCAVPGQVSAVNMADGSVTVITGCGKLRITEIIRQGTPQPPAAFVRGIRERFT